MLPQETINQSIKKRLEFLKLRKDKNNLLVHEIYSSVQGESSYMGIPCVFIRTTGCHLRCSFCDTEHSFFDGRELSLDEIISRVKSFKINLVELTGGEPLLQKPCFLLLEKLCNEGFTVLVETSGAISINNVDRRVKVILDIKTPSSGEEKSMHYNNLNILWPGCEVKFVMGDLEDYDFAKSICEQYDLYNKTHVLFSPILAKIDPKIIAEKMVEDKINARFQIQLHRILWGEEKGK